MLNEDARCREGQVFTNRSMRPWLRRGMMRVVGMTVVQAALPSCQHSRKDHNISYS